MGYSKQNLSSRGSIDINRLFQELNTLPLIDNVVVFT